MLLPSGLNRRRVIEGGRVGQARRLAAAGKRHQEQFAVDREDRGILVGVEANSVASLVKVTVRLGVRLVVGVDLDGQLARLGRDFVLTTHRSGAALVDDPLAVAADAGAADGVLLVVGEPQRRALAVGLGREVLADDVRAAGPAAVLADVVELAGVGRPHRRAVLAVEVREALLLRAVGVADPDVVVARAAIAAAIPRARPAHEGDLIAGRGEVAPPSPRRAAACAPVRPRHGTV